MLFQCCFVRTFFYALFLLNIRVEAPSAQTSIARAGKIEPIRLFASSKPANIGNVHTRSESPSSMSSFSTLTSETSFTQSEPRQNELIRPTTSFNEVELRTTSTGEHRPLSEGELRQSIESERMPMIERAKHVRFMETVDLHDATIGTNSNGNLNPARDGVFARVRSAILLYGGAAVVGTGIGAGIVTIAHHANGKNDKTVETSTIATAVQTFEDLSIQI